MRTPIEIALQIDEDGHTTARALYEFLEMDKSHFSRWAEKNIEKNKFYEENADWWGFAIVANGNNCKDYKLTTDFAKHLCMESHSEKGKIARQYFVKIEDKVKQKAIDLAQLSPELQLFKQMFDTIAQQQLEQKKQAEEISKINDDVKELQAKVETHNEDYYTVAGYASLRGIKVDISKANMFGRKCSKLSKSYGYDIGKTKDPRFGTVNTYHVDILKEVFK